MSDQFDKLLEHQQAEKNDTPTLWISKTIRCNPEDIIIGFFKKLFRRKDNVEQD